MRSRTQRNEMKVIAMQISYQAPALSNAALPTAARTEMKSVSLRAGWKLLGAKQQFLLFSGGAVLALIALGCWALG